MVGMVAWPCYGTMVVRKSRGRGYYGVGSGGGRSEAACQGNRVARW